MDYYLINNNQALINVNVYFIKLNLKYKELNNLKLQLSVKGL